MIHSLIDFLKNGFSTLRKALFGVYRYENEDIKTIRKEMFDDAKSSETDSQRIKSDIYKVGGDMRRSINNVIAGHV